MAEDSYMVQWTGPQAVVSLPEHIDVSNAGEIREELLSVINRGATILITDMAATVSCDQAGADAVVRAYQRATANGTQLRLVVTAPIVRRVLSVNGLDRLIPVYPSLEAATAAGMPAAAIIPRPRAATAEPDGLAPPGRWAPARHVQRPAGSSSGPAPADIAPAVLRALMDALSDGVALADDNGVLALVNRRLEGMFGYAHAELVGRPVESLIPADLREVHRGHRAVYGRARAARPMGAGARLVGLRKDGATLPVEISLSPVPTASGHLTLAVVRDVTEAPRRDDLADLARATATGQERHDHKLLDQIVSSLFQVGVSLQAAIDLPHHAARQRIAEALQRLDDTIQHVRDHEFTARGREALPPPAPPNGGW